MLQWLSSRYDYLDVSSFLLSVSVRFPAGSPRVRSNREEQAVSTGWAPSSEHGKHLLRTGGASRYGEISFDFGLSCSSAGDTSPKEMTVKSLTGEYSKHVQQPILNVRK